MTHVDGDFDPTKFGFPPPLTRKQGLARWAADHEISKQYPNQYVAFIDVWNGEDLDRRVLGTGRTLKESFELQEKFDAETGQRVTVRWIGDPDEVFVPVAFADE